MRPSHRTGIRACILRALAGALAALAVTGCEKGPRRESTSEPQSVDSRQDNAAILEQLTPGLLLRITIRADKTVRVDSHVALVVKQSERRREGDLVEVVGVAGAERIARVWVPDARRIAIEGEGAVAAPDRELVASLPLGARIDSVEVRLPGEVAPYRQPVANAFDAYCEGHPQLGPYCRPPMPAATPLP